MSGIANAEIKQVESALASAQHNLDLVSGLTSNLDDIGSTSTTITILETHLFKSRQSLETMRSSRSTGQKPDPILFVVAKAQTLDHINAANAMAKTLLHNLSK